METMQLKRTIEHNRFEKTQEERTGRSAGLVCVRTRFGAEPLGRVWRAPPALGGAVREAQPRGGCMKPPK
jgi:hypothetical protein